MSDAAFARVWEAYQARERDAFLERLLETTEPGPDRVRAIIDAGRAPWPSDAERYFEKRSGRGDLWYYTVEGIIPEIAGGSPARWPSFRYRKRGTGTAARWRFDLESLCLHATRRDAKRRALREAGYR
jgi:hypothetical protein